MAQQLIVRTDPSPDSPYSGAGKINDNFTELYNVLTTDVQAALAGTDGTPSGSNKYVTDSDDRLITYEPYYMRIPNMPVGLFLSSNQFAGTDGQMVLFLFHNPEQFTVSRFATGITAIGGSGARYMGQGIYSIAGALIVGGVFTPTLLGGGGINEVADTVLPRGSYYYGVYQYTAGTASIFARTIDLTVNSAAINLGIPTTVPILGVATNVGTDTAVPATLGGVTAVAGGIYIPETYLIGSAA